MKGAWPQIDWSQPWYAGVRMCGERADALIQAGLSVSDALTQVQAERQVDGHSQPFVLPAGPLRFVPQETLPDGEAYEAFIGRTACVPTRNNLHDFFNGLMWLTQPQLKRALNRLQAAEIERMGVCATRGPVRDALTVMDENGALIQINASVQRLLQERQWQEALWQQRAAWQNASVIILGHALLEQLTVAPRQNITAHVIFETPENCAVWTAARWVPKPFHPLPISGIPGWWSGQDENSFYQNERIFRPLRRHQHHAPNLSGS